MFGWLPQCRPLHDGVKLCWRDVYLGEISYIYRQIAVADLEIFRGGFSFTKMPAKLKVKTKKKKKVFTSFLSHLFLAAVSLPSSTALKLTH